VAISLSSISRLKRGGRPPIICVYGPPGIGKTTWATSAADAVVIRTEDGLGLIEADTFPLATSFADVQQALGALASEQHSYKWLVIDSLSALEPLIWSAVAQAEGKNSIEDLGYGKGYVIAQDYWRQVFDGLSWLATERGVGSILLAHAEVSRFESPEVDAYDRSQIKLHKRAFGLVYERADVIGYAAPKVMVRKEKLGQDKTRNLGIGTGERLLHLVERPAYVAKNRYSLPETLPLSWPAFEAALSAAVNPAPAQAA
jgi:hypothetical protein